MSTDEQAQTPVVGGKRKLSLVVGLPKNHDQRKFAKMLKDLDVSYAKAKKVFGVESGQVFFENEDQMQQGKEKLETHKLSGVPLKVEKPRERPTNFTPRANSNNSDAKPLQSAQEVVTPWFNLPYDQQLEKKNEEMIGILKSVTKQIKFPKGNITIPAWIKKVQANTTCCDYLGIKRSPILERYRNKTELTIGKDVAGEVCVGYLLGAFKDGQGLCTGSPLPCINSPFAALGISQQFQHFIAKSKYKPYTKVDHTGLWRLLTIRTTETKQSQAALQINPTGLTEQEKKELIDSIRTFVESTPALSQQQLEQQLISIPHTDSNSSSSNSTSNLSSPPTSTTTTTTTTTNTTTTTTTTGGSGPLVDSFYIQEFSGVSNAAPWDCPYQHISGQTHVYEQILGLKFRISPASFLQVNTRSTEVLYSLIGEWANLSNNNDETKNNTILLDICSGIGTIGLTLANKVAKVIGIEIVETAVQDAKFNAQLNGVTNTTYIAGKAEEVLKSALRTHLSLPNTNSPNVIAVVDPPRSGLHPDTLRAIRNCDVINTLVYVSCKQTSLVNDAVLLCKAESKKNHMTHPFVPIKAMAVDLFPHTPHCELVVLFQRDTGEEKQQTTNKDATEKKE